MAKRLSASVTSIAYKVTKTVTGIKCDCCEKVIPVGRWRSDDNKYYEITTGHHDWGSESIESRKTVDICPECVDKYISEYLRDASTTGYLDLKTEYSYADKHSVVLDKPPKEDEVFEEDHDYYY